MGITRAQERLIDYTMTRTLYCGLAHPPLPVHRRDSQELLAEDQRRPKLVQPDGQFRPGIGCSIRNSARTGGHPGKGKTVTVAF